MKGYKRKIYQNYITVHNQALYGTVDTSVIRSTYNLMDHFYGWALPTDKQANILDIGCGEGGFVLYLQEKGFKNASGIDISREQIDKGKELGISNLHEEDLLAFLKRNEPIYDLIVARDVLEHFDKEEVYEICESVQRVLRPGGQLLFQSPNGNGIQVEKIFHGDFTHDTLFTVDSAAQLLKSCGFGEVVCRPALFPVSSMGSLIRFLAWKWIEWNYKLKRKIIYGSAQGVFTPNLLVLATKN